MHRWQEIAARHAAQRRAERTGRRELQWNAAATWRALAFWQAAAVFLTTWFGRLAQAWQVAQPATAKDNAPGRPLPHTGPRPL